MKHKSMSEMNRERELLKAKKKADEETDYRGGKAYYKFLELFYKDKKEKDDKQKTDSSTKIDD